MSPQDQELVALFAGLDTPGVSDARDKLGLPGQCLGIMPLDDYRQVPGLEVEPPEVWRYFVRARPAALAAASPRLAHSRLRNTTI